MSDYPVTTIASAPEGSRELLEATERALGFLPNLHGVLAHSPTLLKSYVDLTANFGGSSFDKVEQQVVLLSVSFENGCTYCVGAHSMAANMVGMDEATLAAIRDGEALPDAKLSALARLTREIVSSEGYPSDAALGDFLAAGYKRAQVLDVIVGVALKTMSNYTNHIAETPLDEAFAPFAWSGAPVSA